MRRRASSGPGSFFLVFQPQKFRPCRGLTWVWLTHQRSCASAWYFFCLPAGPWKLSRGSRDCSCNRAVALDLRKTATMWNTLIFLGGLLSSRWECHAFGAMFATSTPARESLVIRFFYFGGSSQQPSASRRAKSPQVLHIGHTDPRTEVTRDREIAQSPQLLDIDHADLRRGLDRGLQNRKSP